MSDRHRIVPRSLFLEGERRCQCQSCAGRALYRHEYAFVDRRLGRALDGARILCRRHAEMAAARHGLALPHDRAAAAPGDAAAGDAA